MSPPADWTRPTALEIHRILKSLRDEGNGHLPDYAQHGRGHKALRSCGSLKRGRDRGIRHTGGNLPEVQPDQKYRVQLTDGTKHVLLQSPETAGHISSWMNEDKIETLHTCEPTLETVFLEVTGRELQ